MPTPKKKDDSIPSIITPVSQDSASVKPEQPLGQMLFNRPEIPTIYASRMTHTKLNDGHAMLGFYCPTLNGEFEQARIMVTDVHLKRIIDLLCRQSGHYPTPKKDSGKK